YTRGSAIDKFSLVDSNITELVGPNDYYDQHQIAVDGEGNVYVAARAPYFTRSAVLKWTAADNSFTPLASSGPPYYLGVAVDDADNIYLSDAYGGVVQEIPYVFIDLTPRFEGLAAGSDSLPTVLPITANLRAPFAPSTDSPWLNIAGITNGVVSFSFTLN